MTVEGVKPMVTPIVDPGPVKVQPQPAVAPSELAVDTKRNSKIGHSDTPAARYARLGPPIDVTRVSEIRAAIASGTYTVDADRLAEAMLALDLPERDA